MLKKSFSLFLLTLIFANVACFSSDHKTYEELAKDPRMRKIWAERRACENELEISRQAIYTMTAIAETTRDIRGLSCADETVAEGFEPTCSTMFNKHRGLVIWYQELINKSGQENIDPDYCDERYDIWIPSFPRQIEGDYYLDYNVKEPPTRD